MNKREIAIRILDTLEKQDFEDWFADDFLDYIEGESGAKTKEDILKDIEKLFNL